MWRKKLLLFWLLLTCCSSAWALEQLYFVSQAQLNNLQKSLTNQELLISSLEKELNQERQRLADYLTKTQNLEIQLQKKTDYINSILIKIENLEKELKQAYSDLMSLQEELKLKMSQAETSLRQLEDKSLKDKIIFASIGIIVGFIVGYVVNDAIK